MGNTCECQGNLEKLQEEVKLFLNEQDKAKFALDYCTQQ